MTVAYESDRLLLREFAEADAPALFDLDADPEVRRFLHLPPPTSIEPYLDLIRGKYRRYYDTSPGRGGYWAAVERAGGAFLGWFHLRPGADSRYAAAFGLGPDDAELGYRLRREVWGRGYATEMSRVLAAAALADPSTARVVGTALAANLASRRVLDKAGLSLAAENIRLPDIESPAVLYATPTRRPTSA